MKYLPLIWAGLWRKPARTLLTLLSVVIAFLLFGLLQGVDSAFTRIIGLQKLDRMFVDPRFAQPVPYSYKAQVEKVKGITKITEVHFMGAYYKETNNGMGVIFTIPSIWLSIRPEYQIPKAQVNAVVGTRTAAIISDWLALKNNWKIGDHISVKGFIPRKDGSTDWTFDVVGIMRNTEALGESRQMLANYAYLDEARAIGFGAAPVVVSVFVEVLILAALGAGVGASVAWLFFDGNLVSTASGSGRSQLTFALNGTPGLVAIGSLFALGIGTLGGLFPAVRAARKPVAVALRG